MRKVYCVLDNIRSVYNTGATFRTADGAGVEKMYLVGTTPPPIDRFGREREDFKKVSLGAEKAVLWEYFNSAKEVVEELKRLNVSIVAVEQSEGSRFYDETSIGGDVALVFGNEVEGVQETFLKEADHILEIPMRGKKESLNISVSAGIILYHFAS